MTLPTAVYTAYKGYAWSNSIDGVPVAKLEQLYRSISIARGAFPDPCSIEVGLVSDGKIAAAFTLQNVENWDSESRASDYGAFAFFSVERAAEIDFVELLNHDFFWNPSRTPARTLEYDGSPAPPAPLSALQQLMTKHVCLLKDLRSVGTIIAKYGAKSDRWVCLLKAENTLKIECNSWK